MYAICLEKHAVPRGIISELTLTARGRNLEVGVDISNVITSERFKKHPNSFFSISIWAT